jgi:hypothetical protein
MSELLTGAIEGLLSRGAPLIGPYGPGATFLAYADCDEAQVNLTPDDGTEAVALDNLALDLSSSIGRFVALSWLRERGHDLRKFEDSEHITEMLAWSVLSVSRGGKSLVGIKRSWSSVAHRITPHIGKDFDSKGKPIPLFVPDWSSLDATELANGYALVNLDGTLTLPTLTQEAIA